MCRRRLQEISPLWQGQIDGSKMVPGMCFIPALGLKRSLPNLSDLEQCQWQHRRWKTSRKSYLNEMPY